MASNGEIELSGVPAHVWDRLSRHYDRQLWLERAAVRTALDLLAPARDERMLDLATGTGLVLRELAARRDRARWPQSGWASSPARTSPPGWANWPMNIA